MTKTRRALVCWREELHLALRFIFLGRGGFWVDYASLSLMQMQWTDELRMSSLNCFETAECTLPSLGGSMNISMVRFIFVGLWVNGLRTLVGDLVHCPS